MVAALLASRWVLALVLVMAGTAKLRQRGTDELVVVIENYGVPAGTVSALLALLLPWWELALGFTLAVGVLLVPVAACTAVTLAAFAAVVGWHLARGRRFACGCGTGGEISWVLAGQDLVLAMVALAAATGPSAALAAWPGWGAVTVSGAWQAQLPIPLAVVVLMAGWRLARAVRSVMGWGAPARAGRLAG